MSFEGLLIHRCTIQRFSFTTHDAGGQPIETWTDYLTDVPCRFGPDTGRPIMHEAQTVVADYLVDVKDIDVTEADRLIWTNTGDWFKILFVSHAAGKSSIHHHKVLHVQIIRPRTSDVPFGG